MDITPNYGKSSQVFDNIEDGAISVDIYRDIIKGLPLFVLAAERSGLVISSNPAAKRVFGDAEFSGKTIRQVLNPSQGPEILDDVQSTLEEGGQWQGEIRITAGGGAELLLDIMALRVRADDGGYIDFYIGRDITIRRSLERTTCQAEKAATRGEMAGEVAHELNNYLSIVMGNLELMGMALEKGKVDALGPRLKTMKDGVGRIARFVEGLMSLCHPEIRLEIFHLQRLLDEEIFFLKREPRFNGVEFICRWDEALPALEADRSRLRQALVNILGNAADAVANNAPGRRKIGITIAHTADDGLIHLSIWDNGPGMSEEDYARAFRQFFTTKGPGHGFGLLAVKGAIKSQGGKVAVSRGPEGGACVAIELPVKSAKARPTMAPA